MSSLQAAHRGYEYQDLMVAARSVDLLLGTMASAIVDKKLVEDDRFDDLTTIDMNGRRERIQFKHSDREGRTLSLATFTSDSLRQLKLDRLLACAVADRDGPGSTPTSLSFRVILRDSRPTDVSLLRYLKPAIHDPGPFLSEMTSYRMQFDANELWPVQEPSVKESERATSPFSSLRNVSGVTRADVVWLCQRLVIEVEAPAMSADLGVPGAAEAVLLNRAIQDIGAGQHPNAHRAPNDVAEALIRAVRMARQGSIQLSAGEILRRTGLRSDFGAVAHIDPVDPAIEVMRPLEVREIASVANKMAQLAQPLIVEGPPGQGKSWTCKQLVDHLQDEGWLVAEHYCFLGAADNEREARVYTERIFGTLLHLIEEANPSLLQDLRPRFTASQLALEEAVRKFLRIRLDHPIALIVDGLDHVSRIAPPSRASDPSRQLVEELADLTLPAGSVLIVFSQPGDHLAPLTDAGARTVHIEGLSRDETTALVSRHGVTTAETDDTTSQDEIVEAIHLRSRGNALYSTYLCRELLRSGPTANQLTTVNSLPAYDGTLTEYYEHLHVSLGHGAAWVADILAFLNFAVTPKDIRELRPDGAYHVERALQLLGPVITTQAQGSGLRVYHESFSRFLADRLDELTVKAINDRIAQWLAGKGLFADERAYRFLIPTLAKAGRHTEVVDLVDIAFLAKSVAAGFPASAILSNLGVTVGCAVHVDAWPIVVRCIELARGASTFEYERLGAEMVNFADVPIAILGGKQFASRLLFEGQTVVPARTGLLICAALDKQGFPAPWEPYIDAFIKEDATDNTSYGYESDADVYVAILRGRLRIGAIELVDFAESRDGQGDDGVAGWLGTLESLQKLVAYIDESGLPADEVARAVLDTQGTAATLDVVMLLARPASFALAVASQMRDTNDKDSSLFLKFRDLALRSDRSPGTARALLELGAPITAILWGQQQERRARLLQLTAEVQHPIEFDEAIDEWLDLCVLAAIDDPIGLSAAEAVVKERFWYRNWLRFTIQVARVGAAPEERRSDIAFDAIRLLNVDTEPFAGKPRACDLYPVLKQVRETIRRAVEFLDDESWQEALNRLAAMSNSISTSIDGEFGGPFAADDLLHLIVETGAPVARRKGAADLIKTISDKDSANRFYSDLAMYRLIAARLALRCGDRDEAERRWIEASQMLSGYGYRKDRTVFEILDPLPKLIKVDPRRGRERVAAVQSLAERVPAHTDGKETRHAWSTWWKLLALADPAALASLAGTAMVSKCNLPSALHETAREELWKAWQLEVNPVLASLLRSTLELTLSTNDAAGLERLLDTANRPSELDAQIVSLADGRPSRYSVSNSDELLDRDSTLLNELNAIVDRSGAPHITPWTSFETLPIGTAKESRYASALGNSRHRGTTSASPTDFPPGALGVARAARAWRRRPYETTDPMWDVSKYANAIGYRLVELIQEGRYGDADLALRSVAEADRLRFNQDLLHMLAEGLGRMGHLRLAAVAHALVWTRSRGGGGWLTFGGMTGVESLRRALELDREVPLKVIAEEIQRTITDGNLGVTQAIIYAFTLVEMPAPEGANALDIAFQCWDEAAAVIGARAPRVHAWDDPDLPYAPFTADSGAPYLGNLDMAFTLATIAGVSNPGREQKRRSMLSVRMLLEYAPTLVGQAFQTLLPSLSDPATLVWILRLVESSKARTSIVAQCVPALTELAASEYLTVRSLARRLTPAGSVVGPPPTSPNAALLNDNVHSVNLWLPLGHRYKADESGNEKLAAELEQVAGTRIARGEVILPRLHGAVLDRFQIAVNDDQFNRRLERQANAIGRGNGWPDAYVVAEETIESVLQRTAAGGRLAMLANGEGILDHQWEDQLADAIMDDPLAPLDLEAVRHPRPPIPIPPGPASSEWIDIIEHVSGSSAASSFNHTFFGHESTIMAGTKIQASEDCATMIGGRFNGWQIIGSEERRTIIPSSHRDQRLFVHRYSGLEFRERNDKTGFQSPPLSSTNAPLWMLPLPPHPTVSSIVSGQPLVGYDRDMSHYGDAAYGLGIPEQIMVPTGWLRMLWRLEPLAPYLLGDEQGEALALVTWRTEYERSDYHLPWPKIQGSAIVVRPGLLHELESNHGEWLTLRDVIVGPVSMVESAVS